MNVIAVLPAILLGIVGGILGSAFTQLNLLISRTRKRIMARIKGKHAKNAKGYQYKDSHGYPYPGKSKKGMTYAAPADGGDGGGKDARDGEWCLRIPMPATVSGGANTRGEYGHLAAQALPRRLAPIPPSRLLSSIG